MTRAENWKDDISLYVKNRLKDKLILVGEIVEGTAKELCPVDTGNLRGSINYQMGDDGLSVIVGTPVEYAPFVEFGTQFMGGTPFLRGGLLMNKAKILKVLNL